MFEVNLLLQNNYLFKYKKQQKPMNKWIEILIGLVFVIAPVYVWGANSGNGLWGMGTAALTFLKGGIVWFVIMIGLLFLMLGISDLKE